MALTLLEVCSEFATDDRCRELLTRLPLFHSATRDEIAAMAEKNYDEAREEIEANGTLF